MASVKGTNFLKSLLESADGTVSGSAFRTATQLESYGATCRECSVKLASIWDDVGIPRGDQEKEINDVWNSAVEIWTGAVVRAEAQRAALRSRVEEALREVDRIRDELGEEFLSDGLSWRTMASWEGCLKPEMLVGGSLKAKYDAAVELLEDWRCRREKRLQEFGALQTETRTLKARLGHPMLPQTPTKHTKADISLANIEYLRGVLASCHTEQIRKEREMESLLGDLKRLCMELGEDESQAAASAHPSLRSGLIDGHCTPVVGQTATQDSARGSHPDGAEISLCDETFHALELKIDELRHLKDLREQQASDLREILTNLWTALEIPEHDIDRGMFMRLMEGPTRLHVGSIEKCMDEVTRLENAKAQLLEELINSRVIELKELCLETHLPMPDLSPLLGDDFNATEGYRVSEGNIGQIADILAKIVRMVGEVQEIVHHRTEVVGMILELEEARQEIDWLDSYEMDSNRYKGRDCNRRLQRAIRAGRLRERLPEKIEDLREAILCWEQEEGQPFVFDEVNYRTDVLDALAEDLEQRLMEKMNQRANRWRRAGNEYRPPSSQLGPGDHTPRFSMRGPHGSKNSCSLTPRCRPRGWAKKSMLSVANVRTLEASQKENTFHEKVQCMLQDMSPGCSPTTDLDQFDFHDPLYLSPKGNGAARSLVPPLLMPSLSGGLNSEPSSCPQRRPVPLTGSFSFSIPSAELRKGHGSQITAISDFTKYGCSTAGATPPPLTSFVSGEFEGASVRPSTAVPFQRDGETEGALRGGEGRGFRVPGFRVHKSLQDCPDGDIDGSRVRRLSM